MLEDKKYDENILKRDFYIRVCMEDIFNFNKFLLIGGKGSGKTAFYSALRSDIFIDYLQRQANRYQQNYIFIDIISLKTDREKDRYFPINSIDQRMIVKIIDIIRGLENIYFKLFGS